MTAMHLFAVEVAIFACLLFLLSANVVMKRFKYGTTLGDDGRVDLQRTIRAQGNFVEYVPIILIMHLALALLHTDWSVIFALGVLLLIGRLLHASSILYLETSAKPTTRLRIVGQTLTFFVLLASALILLVEAF